MRGAQRPPLTLDPKPTTLDAFTKEGMMQLDEIIKKAYSCKASDIHLKVGTTPHMRLHNELKPIPGFPAFTQEDMLGIAYSMMNECHREILKVQREVDLSYHALGIGRCRTNIFWQKNTLQASIRIIAPIITSIRDLSLPPVLEELALCPGGLIIITGSTGSGKTTTLASMIDWINSNSKRHIITIEDPIEFLHTDKNSLVSQREIGADALNFASALKASLRQDPDVIMLGEMRDSETIETSLIAAETGHLVLTSMHSLDTLEAINRIIASFPDHRQHQVRAQLAGVLRAIAALKLIKIKNEGRRPCTELLIVNSSIRECILDPLKTKNIHSFMKKDEYDVMHTFDDSLFNFWQNNLIDADEALRLASHKDDLKLKIQGISRRLSE